jgi:hypothetical protein
MRIIAPHLLLIASSILALLHSALTLPTPCGSSSSNGKNSRALSPPTFPSTALDTYVNTPDPSFSWADTGITFSGTGWRGHVLNMSSQKWWVRASTADASSCFLTHFYRMNESATTRSVWQVHTPPSPLLPTHQLQHALLPAFYCNHRSRRTCRRSCISLHYWR